MSYTIPQIPVTALSILIDDFLELGGVSGGSRKFLASTFVLTTDPRLSALGTVTSVSASGGATGLSFTGSPITETGTLLLAGTLAPTSGGTGNTTYAVGDLIQASSSTALARLAAVAAGNVLLSGGVNTVSSWGKVGIGTHVSGLGTGIAAALAVSTGSAGAPVLFDGALGTPTGGNASNLTALNATQLTSGTVPDNRFPGTLPAVSGANLTALNATQLTSGTVPDGRFPATLPTTSGANLTALNASQLTSGTVSNARTTATSANTINTIVARDGSGNFAAGVGTFTALTAANALRATSNATTDTPSSALDYIAGKARVWSWGPDASTLGTFAVRLARSDGSTALAPADEPLTVTATGTTIVGTLSASGQITGNLTGTVTGNAATATQLLNPRTIAITGDLAYTSPNFDGTGNVTAAGTLATVATAGTTGSSTAIPVITINAKGLTTSISTAAVVAPAGTLSGTTLAAGVTGSSLTSVGTLAGLTVTAAINGSVTGSSGSTTGNAATATKLITPRAINGVNFDGSADITVTAAAGTLSGTTLAAGVTGSSLTSVGTLTGLSTSGQITSTLAIGTAPFSVASTTNVPNLNAGLLNGATADTANTANKIVARDGTGNFAAGTITANLTGTASDVANSAVIAKVLTGYTSNAGTVAATDSILQAIQKLNGNDGNLQPLDAALTALALGSEFVKFTGPTTAVKTFTLPNADATILTNSTAVTVAQGGTGLTALGTAGQVLRVNTGATTLEYATTGDVSGPASSIDNRVALFNGAGGKTIKDSGILASDVVVQGGNATLSIAAITQLKLAPDLGYVTTGSITFDLSKSRNRIALTGNLTVSATSNRSNDASSVLELYNPTANSLTLTWSLLTSWKTNGNGALPTTIPPGQTFQFLFQCWGTAETDVSINFITPLNRKEFNVRDYGAKGDYNGASGGTADEAAINAAAAALVASEVGGCLYFPAGRYKKTTKLTMSLGNVLDGLTIKGDGPGASQIVFVGANLGIDITVASPQQEGFLNHTPVDVMDIAIATQETSGAGTAFIFNGAKSSAGVRALRISNVLIRGFAVTGESTIQSWDSCISVTSAEGVFINNVYASVKTVSADTFIVKYDNGAFGPCSILDIAGCSFQGSDKCVWVVGTNGPEGVIVRGTTLVNVNWGVYWDTTTDEEDLKLSDSHVNAYKGCVYANNLFRSFIHDNNLFVDPSSTTGPTNLLRFGGARYGTIHNNFMRAPDPINFSAPAYVAGTTYVTGNRVSYLSNEYTSLVNSNTGNTPSSSPAQWSPDHVGVRLVSQTGMHITDNILQRFGTDVVLENGSDGNTVVDNRSFNNSEVAVAFTFTDAGTNNVVDCQGSVTWDPASLVSGQQDFVNISCPGVKFGAQCTVGVPYDVQNMFVQATVTSANIVRVAVYNSSGGTVDLGSGTWTVRAINPET